MNLQMKTQTLVTSFIPVILSFCFLVTLALLPAKTVSANTIDDIYLRNGDTLTKTIFIGDTGVIKPDFTGLTDASGNAIDASSLTVSHMIDIDGDTYDWEDYANDSDYMPLSLDSNGNYTAMAYGTVTVLIRAYLPSTSSYSYYGDDGDYSYGTNYVFSASCTFDITIDTSAISLMETNATIYAASAYLADVYCYGQAEIHFDNSYSLNDWIVPTSFKYTNQKKISLYCSLTDNVLSIEVTAKTTQPIQSTVLTYTIADKAFEIPLTIRCLSINKRGLTAPKGSKYTLKIKGSDLETEWTSSNPKIVSVSKNGTIKLRKKGNAVITATIGDFKFGCAVSSVSGKMMKVIKFGTYMGKHWKYSQAKRMKKGYYDCSSLVYKAYLKGGKKICNATGYAPVAADIAKWYTSHGKVLANSYRHSQVNRMVFLPGDLAFRTGAKNGRYKGIYHVEMFTGYSVAYYNSKGKPYLNERWAVRPEGYYGSGLLMIRPFKNF